MSGEAKVVFADYLAQPLARCFDNSLIQSVKTVNLGDPFHLGQHSIQQPEVFHPSCETIAAAVSALISGRSLPPTGHQPRARSQLVSLVLRSPFLVYDLTAIDSCQGGRYRRRNRTDLGCPRKFALPAGSILPGLANFPMNRVAELTPSAWAARN